MADKEASLIIKLKDEASAGMKSMAGTLAKVAAAVAAVKVVVMDSIKAYMEQETVTNKMNNALKTQGIYSKELSAEMVAYSKSIQNTTTFSDEAVISQMSLLTTFGLAGKEMKQASEAARNMSTSLGIDLNSATMLVGKAFQGNTAALSRYGIQIEEGLTPTEKFAAVMGQLNSRFGGASAAATNTYAGKLAMLKNQFGEVQEEVGQALIPVLGWLATQLAKVFNIINQFGGLGNTLALMFASFGAGIVDFVTTALTSIPGVSQLFKMMGIDLKGISDQLDANVQGMMKAAEDEAKIGNQMLLDKTIKTNLSNQIDQRAADARKKQRDKEWKEKKKDLDAGYQAYLANERNVAALDKEMAKQKIENFKATANYISSLSTAKNKQLAAVGKAAAITIATMDTYAAANVALKSAPPPWNFALAAAVVTAGLFNVAKIAGMQLARGGIVMPSQGGTTATIGEGGRPEAVIPLGDSRTNELLGEAGLGGGMNLTLNVGVLLGTENNVRELAMMIDRELYTLRRNNESVSLGAV